MSSSSLAHRSAVHLVLTYLLFLVLAPPSPAQAQDEARYDNLLSNADSLVVLGRVRDAEKDYQAALRINKESIPALNGLGKIAYAKQDWKNIKKWFTKVLALDPRDGTANYHLRNSPVPELQAALDEASKLQSGRKYTDARKAYRKALKIYKGALPAMRGLGEMAFDTKDWSEAKNWYKKLLEFQPLDMEAKYALGVAYREAAKHTSFLEKKIQFGRSKNQFESAIKIDSTYKDILYQRGLLEREKRNWTDAIQWGERQVRLKPDMDSAQIGLFKLYRLFSHHKSDNDVTGWLYRQESDWATFFMGDQHRRKDRFAEADAIFQRLLATDLPMGHEPVYLALVRLNIQLENSDEAHRYFQIALDSIETNLDAEFLFEDLEPIFNDRELGRFRALNYPHTKMRFLQIFWSLRSPTLASVVNLRALEHFRRLIYAEENYWDDRARTAANNPDAKGRLRFPAVFALNEEFNDKGLVYIRHGEPDERANTLHPDLRNESWLYREREDRPKFIFHFLSRERNQGIWRLTSQITDQDLLEDRLGWDPYLDHLWQQGLPPFFESERGSAINQIILANEEVVYEAMSTDSHSWDAQVKPLDLYYYWSYFDGQGSRTRMEVYVATPLSQLQGNGDKRVFSHGASVYDLGLNEIKKIFETVNLDVGDSLRVFDNYFVQKYTFSLQPASYMFSLYADQDRKRIGGFKVRIEVPPVEEVQLAISDLTLAYKIQPGSQNPWFKNGDLTVVPNPGKAFDKAKPLYLYFEVYNLRKDADGETSFAIDNEMASLRKSSVAQTSAGQSQGGKSISIRETRTGADAVSVEYFSFDVSNLESGEHQITVTINDLISGQTVRKSIDLLLRRR